MPAGLAPGVHVAPPPPAAPVEFATDTAGFVGIAAKGPVGTAVTLTGWPQFVAQFGDFLPNAFLAYAVRGFFDNGGRRCIVVRAAAPEYLTVTTGAQPADGSASVVAVTGPILPGALVTLTQETTVATTGVQPADRASSLVLDAHGFAEGAPVLVTQPGAPNAVARVRAVDLPAKRIYWAEPLPAGFDITQPISLATHYADNRLVTTIGGTTIGWDRPIAGRLDPALPLTLAAGAGTAGGTIPGEDGLPLLGIAAASPGQWGNGLAVRVTTTLARETQTRRRDAPDAADRLSVEALTGLAVGSLVELLQDGATTVRRRVASLDPATRRVGLDLALAGFDLAGAAAGTKPIRLRRRSFTLSIANQGQLVETFVDLDLPTAATVDASPVNVGSRTIRIRPIAGGADYGWPDPASGLLHLGRCLLAGGRDGIAMLRPDDLLGRADEAERRGLRRFEVVGEPSALAIPDAVIPAMAAVMRDVPVPPAPDPCLLCPGLAVPSRPLPVPVRIEASPTFSADDVRTIDEGLIAHCEASGMRIALVDPPLAAGPDPYAIDDLQSWRQSFDSSYAAAYFPWATIVDPIATPPATTRAIPASGHALGQFSLADAEPGRPVPANRPLGWVAALPKDVGEEEHALLNEAGINVLTCRPGRGPRIMGARTLSSDADWKMLNVRRLVIRLKLLLARALDWTTFEPNDRHLTDTVIAVIEGFLEDEWIAQRLRGATAQDAFYVTPRTTQDDFDNGRFVLEIGIAPSLPAEFLILRLARTADRLDVAEIQDGGWPK
ncbi:phage tail sheath subtilisin-like domain-containing protein [Flavisphingomonas formosensis]|uniref:phage tail sheath subtilisin-like domain-containing protein n=1 Tax=Flavisphingomonas formosensis TaxID=861534 RepID=UPI0012FCDC39|nr:phage tail sheath subtilisin-like domain-containing protein [Sphingomonas formosensis]